MVQNSSPRMVCYPGHGLNSKLNVSYSSHGFNNELIVRYSGQEFV